MSRRPLATAHQGAAVELTKEQVIAQLGDLFLACEGFMVEMRNKDAFHGLTNEFAETMLSSRDMLRAAGHPPVATRRSEPLTYTRDHK